MIQRRLMRLLLNSKKLNSSINQTRIRNMNLRKNRPPKKWSRWKNRTSRTKNVAISLKSYERQCRSDSFSHKNRGAQGLAFAQITFETFENVSQISILKTAKLVSKTRIADSWLLLA